MKGGQAHIGSLKISNMIIFKDKRSRSNPGGKRVKEYRLLNGDNLIDRKGYFQKYINQIDSDLQELFKDKKFIGLPWYFETLPRSYNGDNKLYIPWNFHVTFGCNPSQIISLRENLCSIPGKIALFDDNPHITDEKDINSKLFINSLINGEREYQVFSSTAMKKSKEYKRDLIRAGIYFYCEINDEEKETFGVRIKIPNRGQKIKWKSKQSSLHLGTPSFLIKTKKSKKTTSGPQNPYLALGEESSSSEESSSKKSSSKKSSSKRSSSKRSSSKRSKRLSSKRSSSKRSKRSSSKKEMTKKEIRKVLKKLRQINTLKKKKRSDLNSDQKRKIEGEEELKKELEILGGD